MVTWVASTAILGLIGCIGRMLFFWPWKHFFGSGNLYACTSGNPYISDSVKLKDL